MKEDAIFAPMAVPAFIPQNGLLCWYDFGNKASFNPVCSIDPEAKSWIVDISPPKRNPIKGATNYPFPYSGDCGGYINIPSNANNYAGIYTQVSATTDPVPYNMYDTLSVTAIIVCRPYKNNVNIFSDLGLNHPTLAWHCQLMGVNSTNKLVGTAYNSTSGFNNTITSSIDVKLGQWNMLTYSYYNPSRSQNTVGTLSVYVDDQLGATTNLAKRSNNFFANGGGIYLGCCNYEATAVVPAPNQFAGDVMAVLWYNRALNATEVAGIYAYYSPRFTQSTTPAPTIAGTGYVCGGQSGGSYYAAIDKIVFNTNIVSGTPIYTPTVLTNSCAFSATASGYMCGGLNPGYTKNFVKLYFATPTCSALSSAYLSVAKQVSMALYSKSSDVGYVVGGLSSNTVPIATADKFIVATEISGNLPVGIGSGGAYGSAVSATVTDRGYVAGGTNTTDPDSGTVTYNTRMTVVDYTTDLINASNIRLTYMRQDTASFYNDSFGYFLGGYDAVVGAWMNGVEKISYDTEVISVAGSAVIPYPAANADGMQSSVAGYTSTWYNSNLQISVFITPFATEVTTALSTGLTYARDRGVCVAPAVF